MNSKPDGIRNERVKEPCERSPLYLARRGHGRTPRWATGAFDPRDVRRDALVEVAQAELGLPWGGTDVALRSDSYEIEATFYA
jgi:hypothetical protein